MGLGDYVTALFGVVLLAITLSRDPRNRIVRIIGTFLLSLFFLASATATVFLFNAGSNAHWTSDGPGMLIVMLGVGLFGLLTVVSFFGLLNRWRKRVEDGATTETSEPILPGPLGSIPGIGKLGPWPMYALAVFMIVGPLVRGFTAKKHFEAVTKTEVQTLDFSKIETGAQGVAGARWVLSLQGNWLVLRLGSLSPEWVIPTSIKTNGVSAPVIENRYVLLNGAGLEVWDLEQKKRLMRIERSADRGAVLLGEQGRFLTAMFSRGRNFSELVVWDLQTNSIKFRQEFLGYLVGPLVADPLHRRIAVSTESKQVLVYDLLSNRMAALRPESSALTGVTKSVFSPDGEKLAVGTGVTVEIYNLQSFFSGTTSAPQVLSYPRSEGCRGGLEPIGFSKSSNVLWATDAGFTFQKFNLPAGGKPQVFVHRVMVPGAKPSAARFNDVKTYAHALNSDGSELITYPEGPYNLVRWNVTPAGEVVGPVNLSEPGSYGVSPVVRKMEFSPDGRWLVVDAIDRHFWDLQNKKRIQFQNKFPAKTSLAQDGVIQDCALDPQVCVQQAEAKAKVGETTGVVELFSRACDAGDAESCRKGASGAELSGDLSRAEQLLNRSFLLMDGDQVSIEALKKLSEKVFSSATPIGESMPPKSISESCQQQRRQEIGDFVAVPYLVNGQCKGIRIHSIQRPGWFKVETGDVLLSNDDSSVKPFCTLREFKMNLEFACSNRFAKEVRPIQFDFLSNKDSVRSRYLFN